MNSFATTSARQPSYCSYMLSINNNLYIFFFLKRKLVFLTFNLFVFCLKIFKLNINLDDMNGVSDFLLINLSDFCNKHYSLDKKLNKQVLRNFKFYQTF
jgi:hypothetical protein